MRKSKIKRHILSASGNIIILALLTAFALPVIIAVYTLILNSLNPSDDVFFGNYTDLIYSASAPFGVYALNSLAITTAAAILRLWIIFPAAYVLAKVNLPGRRILNTSVEVALLFSAPALYVMQYAATAKLGLADTLAAIILPPLSSAPGLFIAKRSIEQIPDSIIEAARMDGAGGLCIYRRIILPNLGAVRTAIVVFTVADVWRVSGTPFVYAEELKPLYETFRQLNQSGGSAGIVAAVCVAVALPPIIVYALCGKSVRNTMAYAELK